jgi:integrase/recombinase XerD
MLEDFYQSSKLLLRLRQAPLASVADGLADKFRRLGYSKRYSQRILWIVGKFNDFARSLGIKSATDLNESLLQLFMKNPIYCTFAVSVAMHHLKKQLCDQGIVQMIPHRPSCDPFETILSSYDAHLGNVRGLAPSSRTQSLCYARRFLTWLQTRHGSTPLLHLNGVDVLEYITQMADLYPSGSWRNCLCSGTRVFLRYLRWKGLIHADLDRAVPKIRQWRLRQIPRHLSWEKVLQLIESVDTSKPIGLRDKAVLLLIATLGLRNQEVRTLQLNDISWRNAEIRLRKTKTRREKVLPLPGEVGAAIARYLIHGRPHVGMREVFLRHFTPVGPITSTHGIGDIIKKHLRKAGIQASNHGAHLLRHSLATRMVNQAVPIKQIADMLGHTSIDTTAIYTKVETTGLAAVALPFPGGVS